ncbi:MAG TPA: GNAT family N-acetyltransferase [Gammaproteobacteria bacterium]|nr:GNAT family N-acetyltransferase [Gammaproteobacteria bacterium]
MSIAATCREATKADLPAVLQLYAQPDLDDGKVLSLSEAEAIFERMARYPDYKVYVAVSQAQIVGTFALLIMDNLGHCGAPSGVVEDVAVDPDWQSQGIGKRMMLHALELCREKGCYKVVLSSNLKSERAHTFYQSLGFERHGYSFRVVAPEAHAIEQQREEA